MRSRKKLALLAAVAVAAPLAVSVALAASPGDVTSTDLRRLEPVDFLTVCRFSHRKPDDPIVFPGRPGLSHGHTFVGNESTDAFSTPKSLRAAATTCDRSEDTAAYWAPTLLVDDQPVTPVAATVYYRRRTIQSVRAFPPGLEMVAGDSHALEQQSLGVTWWDCGDRGGIAPSSTVPTCPPGPATSLRLHVRFPDCWDGRHLDSPDHKSHMAYSKRGRCDEVHPVRRAVALDHDAVPSRGRPRGRAELDGPVLRACRLRQCLAAGRAEAARGLLPERPPRLR